MTGDAANVGTSPLEAAELAGGAAAPAVKVDCTADAVADTLDDAVVAAAAAAAATAAGACVTGAAVNVDAVEASVLFFSAAADKLLPIAAMDGADGKATISAICFTSFFALLSAIPAVFGAMNPPPLDA